MASPTRPDPRKLGAQCKECPFAKDGEPRLPVFGEGPLNPRGVVVGEWPGREDAEEGRPFRGLTGREFDAEMLAVKLPRKDLYLITACCCRPPIGVGEAERGAAVKACLPALKSQLKHIPAETPVLALGTFALMALTGKKKGMKKARGFLRPEWTLENLKDD